MLLYSPKFNKAGYAIQVLDNIVLSDDFFSYGRLNVNMKECVTEYRLLLL